MAQRLSLVIMAYLRGRRISVNKTFQNRGTDLTVTPGMQTFLVAAPGEVAGMFVRPIPPDQLELSWIPASAASTLEVLVTDPRGDGSSTRVFLRPLIDQATPGEGEAKD